MPSVQRYHDLREILRPPRTIFWLEMHRLWRDHRSGDFREPIFTEGEVNWKSCLLNCMINQFTFQPKERGKRR
jgi:hypothetical protein